MIKEKLQIIRHYENQPLKKQYKRLREIEDLNGIEASEKFLKGFLDSKNTDYDTYIERLITDNLGSLSESSTPQEIGETTEKKKGSFFKRFFGIE